MPSIARIFLASVPTLSGDSFATAAVMPSTDVMGRNAIVSPAPRVNGSRTTGHCHTFEYKPSGPQEVGYQAIRLL